MTDLRYAVRFDFPEGTVMYACITGPEGDPALGWTFNPDSALRFDDRAGAERTLANGYGHSARHGSIILVNADNGA